MITWLRNILTRASIENPNTPISSADMWDIIGANPSASGVRVNKETVLGSAGVWRAVNLISSSVARLPIITYQRERGGGRQRATTHPAFYLLKKHPSPQYTAYSFVQTLQGHALLHGNGYAYIFRNDLGQPEDLTILDPTQTYPAKEDRRLVYVTTIEGEDRKLLSENVVHLKGLGFDGLAGYSAVSVLKDQFGHDLALLKFGNTFFKHGSAINCVVEMPGYFRDEEAIKRFRETWGSMHTGLDNAHRLAILENGAKVSRLTYTNEEAQYLQSREFDLKALANIFGLPASYLGANINTSYGSLEAENKTFLNHTLGGWLTGWEQELESKLLTEAEKKADSHFIEFERKALERADLTTEISALVQQVNNGLLSLNEARQILNKPVIEGGDSHRLPLNLGVLGEQPPEPPPEPPEQSQEEKEDNEADRGQALVEGILSRLIRRIGKDTDRAGTAQFLERHLGVAIENLAPLDGGWVAEWLTELNEELGAVLPEQRQAALDRIDVIELSRRLWKDETIH